MEKEFEINLVESAIRQTAESAAIVGAVGKPVVERMGKITHVLLNVQTEKLRQKYRK